MMAAFWLILLLGVILAAYGAWHGTLGDTLNALAGK